MPTQLPLSIVLPPNVVAPASATLSISPVEYVVDAFEQLIVPGFGGDTPLKKSVRVHLYRKMLLQVLQEELLISIPLSLDQVFQLTMRCFERLGLS